MNCETCQELIHDLIDGIISQSDEFTLNTHLKECLDCDSVRQDLASIVGFCRTQRGQYEAPPNEQAMWLRIRNVIEAELPSRAVANTEPRTVFLRPADGSKLGAFVAATGRFDSRDRFVGFVGDCRWIASLGWSTDQCQILPQVEASNVNDRISQRRQVIDYWNQRVELNKARWSPEMRETFDRNMKVIDQAVANSLNELNRNPHDEVSEQMLNESLNDKLRC